MVGNFVRISGVLVLSLGFVACDDAVDATVDATVDDGGGAIQARDMVWNDWRLNDWRLNDWRLNGFQLNNFDQLYNNNDSTSIQLFSYYLPGGGYAYDASLIGGMLEVDGLTGWDVEDTTFDFKIRTNIGTPNEATSWKYVWLKWAWPVAGFSDVWEYDADISYNGGWTWEPLCKDPSGKRTRTLLLGDVWDPSNGAKLPRPADAITFACKDAALAKCVLFGYRPWATRNGTSLADYHQACTRMVRADYCGNGTSHTNTGTPIHVLDQIGLQNASTSTSYAVEAEWGPNGATCLNPGNTRLSNQTIECSIPTCGASFASGGLIQSGKLAN